MQIKNKTRKTLLTDNAQMGLRIDQRFFGLILFKKPSCMIFYSRFGIHTFFMSYPIDVIILNKNYQVVKIKKKLKPNRIFLWKPIHKTIIELPPGTIANSKTSLGDFLELI